jgi:hypothetical protein
MADNVELQNNARYLPCFSHIASSCDNDSDRPDPAISSNEKREYQST